MFVPHWSGGVASFLDRQASGSVALCALSGFQVLNGTCLQAGDVAVRIVPISIKPPAGSIETLDQASALKRFKVLIHGGVADFPALLIELFKNVSCAQMTGFTPQQVEHHSPLSAQSHAQVSATIECVLKGALLTGSLWQK